MEKSLGELLSDLSPKTRSEKEWRDIFGDPSKGISVPCAPYSSFPKPTVIFLNFIVPLDEFTKEKQAELIEQYECDMRGYSI